METEQWCTCLGCLSIACAGRVNTVSNRYNTKMWQRSADHPLNGFLCKILHPSVQKSHQRKTPSLWPIENQTLGYCSEERNSHTSCETSMPLLVVHVASWATYTTTGAPGASSRVHGRETSTVGLSEIPTETVGVIPHLAYKKVMGHKNDKTVDHFDFVQPVFW